MIAHRRPCLVGRGPTQRSRHAQLVYPTGNCVTARRLLINSAQTFHHTSRWNLSIIMLNTFTIFYVPALNYSSPPTHFTRAPPSHAKNCYLNSKLMILHASELATELFDEVQSPRCTFAIVTALPAWSRHVHGITQ